MFTALTCYMCDTAPTGVSTTIPDANQRQPDCGKTSPAVLAKFAVNCDKFTASNFDKCETALSIGSDGKGQFYPPFPKSLLETFTGVILEYFFPP